ncbi:MAG: DUF1232 domain-containing protein [Rhizobiales bacterium]|nr:DUF1232 domain-containing protein [Hyphomicrobiales bacterium]
MTTSDLESERAHLPMVLSRNEEAVRDSFWPKLSRVLAHIPFAEDAVAAFYCAFDPATPLRAKAILLAALVYFIVPFDVIPDVIVGLGFTDDMAVLFAAIGLIRSHMTEEHHQMARQAVERLKRGEPIAG